MEKFELGNTGLDPTIRTESDRIPARFGHLNKIVDVITELQQVPPGSGIASVQGGTNITVDDTDPLNPIVNAVLNAQSGTYSPTISEVVNDIMVEPNVATYIKVGGIATVSVQLSIIMDEFQNTGSFEVSLPVASNFTSQKQCFGLLQWSYSGGNMNVIDSLSIGANLTNNTCQIDIGTVDNGQSLQFCTLQIQYEIV
jgi:hypothetical protein